MRVIAYMPVLNEADVLPWALSHLRSQGISVIRVLDGGSTDGSREIAHANGALVETCSAEGKQICADILHRIEELAQLDRAEGYDWCYYTDADEIRRSSRDGETLVEAIARLDALGYNVIDHVPYTFYPNGNGPYRGAESPESHFRQFVDSGDPWTSGLGQQKLWKNDAAVKLAAGGHRVDRPDKRVSPEKFVLKHFPYRSQEHLERKLAERLARRCDDEHAKGWGTHYDPLVAGEALPKDLKYWPDPVTSAHPVRELKLNLGCADQMMPGFVNVDACEPADQLVDLNGPWPWADGSVSAVRAHDLIEHLSDKLHTMNEAWRVLKPGGLFEILVPTTDGRAAWQDPTHVSFWNRHSFWYFEAGNPYRERSERWTKNLAAFRVLGEQDISTQDGPKLAILLAAVKPEAVDNTVAPQHSMWATWPARIDKDNFRREGDYLAQVESWGGQKFTIENYRATYEYVKSIDRFGYLDLFREDGAFGAVTFDIDGRLVSRDLLDSIMEIYFLHEMGYERDAHINVLDIGAGYGRFAHRLTKAFPDAYVFCTDAIRESTEIGARYLAFRGVNRATAVSMEAAAAIVSGTVDLAVNIHSWSECPLASIREWLDILDAKKVPALFLVPHTPACVSMEADGSSRDFYPIIIERMSLKSARPKYPVSVQGGIYPTQYYCFERTAGGGK